MRNAAGLIDSSPLYKYRITGPDAERFLGGVLARDIRTCRHGQAQYTIWCDERGYVNEDGVVFRYSADDFMLTAAEPNLAYFQDLIGYDRRRRSTMCRPTTASLAIQGPRSHADPGRLAPQIARLGYFDHAPAKIGNVPVHDLAHRASRATSGSSCGSGADDANEVWDALFEAGTRHGSAARRSDRLADGSHRSRPAADPRRLPRQPLRVERRTPLDAARARLRAGCSRASAD